MRAGTDYTAFDLDSPALRVGPLVCFEDTVGDLTRHTAAQDVQVLVNITNDSWFGTSPGSIQHLDNALFRAIETRRPLIRDANTGVTCIIDAEGRVLQTLKTEEGSTFFEGVLFGTAQIPRDPPTTFYMLHGDWLPLLSSAVTFAALLIFLLRRNTAPAASSDILPA